MKDKINCIYNLFIIIHYHKVITMYATTRYNFVRLKAMHKISPLEELVGGKSPPSSSQRLTGMQITRNTFPSWQDSLFLRSKSEGTNSLDQISYRTYKLYFCIYKSLSFKNFKIMSPATFVNKSYKLLTM
jgi:hypothetical protein